MPGRPHRTVTPYLDNGSLKLDNNSAELAVKPLDMGRKTGRSPVPKAAPKPWPSPCSKP
ncbi:MAG: transposase [Rhodobacteraceae bacterium]|nr:transposase [Paracoccaceae bacterium]